MRKNFKCYACYYFNKCDKELEEKCEKHNYSFYISEKEIEEMEEKDVANSKGND